MLDYAPEGPGDLCTAADFGTDAQHWTITLELPEGANIECRHVRGTWNAVEQGPECEESINRHLKVEAPPAQCR